VNAPGSGEGEAATLERLSELARLLAHGLATGLASRAERPLAAELPARQRGPSGGADDELAWAVRNHLRGRRAREAIFGVGLFADPVWDVLLDLFASQIEGRRVCVSDACMAASVPATTALRWLATMEQCNVIVRRQDKSDGRRSFVALSGWAAAAMDQWVRCFLVETERPPARTTGEEGGGPRCISRPAAARREGETDVGGQPVTP
jgi:hypothetical protein